MHDKTLLSMAIITAFIGLLTLSYFFLKTNESFDLSTNNKIDDTIGLIRDQSLEIIQGRVVNVIKNKHFTSVKLENSCNTTIIAFKALNISKGDFIRVLAKKNNKKANNDYDSIYNQEFIALKIVKLTPRKR